MLSAAGLSLPPSKRPHLAACGSSLKKEDAKASSLRDTDTENVVEMVRRSAEEVDDDKEIAICVSSRFFGFLTENGIMQLFELPHDCLTHKSSQVRYSFKKLQMIKTYKYRERFIKGTNPNYTDFISELLQLLKCFGFVTGYESAVLPKPGCKACVEVTVSLLGLGEQFGTGGC